QGELVGVRLQSGHDDRPRARGPGGDDAGEAALPGAEHQHGVSEPDLAEVHRPAHARAERVEHDGQLGGQRLVDLVQDGARGEVEVLGEPAPQRRGNVDPGDAVAVLAVPAGLVAAGEAVVAGAARHDHLERHPVARLHAPALGGALADPLDDPHRLVPRDRRPAAHPEVAAVGLDVAAADPVRLDPQQPVVGADRRARERAQLDRPRRHLDGRAHHVGHQPSSFVSPGAPSTGTAVADQSLNRRTTMEIPALRAPATAISRWLGSPSASRRSNPSGRRPSACRTPLSPMPSLPTSARSPTVRPQRSASQARTFARSNPAFASSCACSGQNTTPAEAWRKIQAPVREIVSAKSASSCSGSLVWRLSTNSQVRSRVADTADVPAGSPASTESGSQGLSSSFSAMQIDQRPGSPWVACSNTWGWMPSALRTMSPIARGTVALGRKPGPNTPPALLNPSSSRTGPLTTISGAGPLVDCQPPPRVDRS